MSAQTAIANLTKDPVKLAIGAALLIGVVYLLARKTVKDVAQGAASVVSGNNAITQNQTNASGEKTDAYEGKGVLGTVGATVNSALGGVPASVGETVGGWFYDLTHLDYQP